MLRRSLVLLALLVAVPPPASASWRAPVDGPLVARFRLGPDPYAAGQRRGIDLAATAGAEVRAPCRGRVTFAGATPPVAGVPRGAAVTLRCGARTATVLGLASTTARRGASVSRGAALGRAASGRIRLSARATTGRRAYLDPLALLAAAPTHEPAPPVAPRSPAERRTPPAPGTPPAPRTPAAPRTPPAPRTPRPHPTPARATPAAGPVPAAPAPAIPVMPLAAWPGIGLIAVALPAWGVGARGRRRASGTRAPAYTTSVEPTI